MQLTSKHNVFDVHLHSDIARMNQPMNVFKRARAARGNVHALCKRLGLNPEVKGGHANDFALYPRDPCEVIRAASGQLASSSCA